MTKIGSREYTVESLPITTQFSLAALLSPVISIMSMQKDRAELEKKFPQSFTALCGGMEPENHRWIMDTCLGTVRCKDPSTGLPTPVWVGGMQAFQDIDLVTMLKLIWLVIEHHRMLDFFGEGPSGSTGQPGGQTVSSGQGSQKDTAG